MEMLMLAGLLAYFANFFAGKTKNARLAQLWYSTHKGLLDDNFVLVGRLKKSRNLFMFPLTLRYSYFIL